MAATWVREIEDSADKAQGLAMRARDAFHLQNPSEAIQLIEQACELERRWHSEPIWERLKHAIHNEISLQTDQYIAEGSSAL